MEQLLDARIKEGNSRSGSWSYRKVKDFADVVTGGTPSTNKPEYWQGGTIPWLNSGELNQDIVRTCDNYITEAGLKNSNAKMMPIGSVLVALTGATTGKTAYLEFEACANQSVTGILPSDNHDAKFLYHYISSLRKKILADSYGGAQKHISQGYVKEIPILLPPLPIQQKIAAILDEADALHRKDVALLAKYDDLLQAVFYDMFGEDLKVNNSKILLSDVSEIVSGVAKNTNAMKDDFIEVPYMRVANVQDGHINLSEVKLIKVSQSDYDKYLLRADDILLTEGGDPDKLGRGAVWNAEVSPCIHQNHIFRVRITNDQIEPIFLSYLLSSRYGKAYFLRAAKQTTGIASINMTQLKNFKVIIPAEKLQKKFVNAIKNIERQKSQILQQQANSENLFQSLMQRALKGELDR